MTRRTPVSAITLAIALGWALPAQAQSADPEVARELAAMRAQMQQMQDRIAMLEGQLATTQAKAEATSAALAAAPVPTAKAKPATEITWDGAPKLATGDGWSFKPRGRLQLDVAGVDAPDGVPMRVNRGITTEFRRAFLGFDGTMPGGFAYRIEADIANSGVELTDLYLSYKATPAVTLTVGQHKPFWGLEELTSDLFTSYMERAAFNSAFGFERRIGASASYSAKSLLVQGGVFTDNARDLTDANNSVSFDGRVVFMPKLGEGQLHLGGSAHYRRFNDAASTASYGVRPFVHTTDVRLVNTGNIAGVNAERSFGAELAYVRGRFHATAESHWLTAMRPGRADPTFNGGYAELGFLLTDDVTAYKGSVYDRIRPKRPVGKGGIGAVQVNARYDWLDLSDAGVVGGRQQIAAASVLWIPTDYVRFILNYGHIWLDDAALAAPAGVRDYQADSIGLRAQFDF